MNNRRGADALMEQLVVEGVDTMFGYPGGSIMPAYDALVDYRDRIRHILVRHEQGAAHAAEGYARMAGRPGVCMVTSGPGATNLLTGIADAMSDSIPLVCITGQVAASLIGTDAFQEAPIIGMSTPVTKWCYQVTRADEIPEVIARAFAIAVSGRPGPVVVDITKNALTDTCTAPLQQKQAATPTVIQAPERALLEEAAILLNGAKRPYVLFGHGVSIAGAEKELCALVEKGGFPLAATLLGRSSVPTDHPLYQGMLGMHGNYAANLLTNKADVVLAVGMRFDDRVTGNVSSYAPDARIIHIDIDAAELNKIVHTTLAIRADAKAALAALVPRIEEAHHDAWLAEFKTLSDVEAEKIEQPELSPTSGPLHMAEVVRALTEVTEGRAVLVADVGQHQMAAARYYDFSKDGVFITSGGLGTMGFALPAGIGAKIATPERMVVALMGDGSAQMNIQELGTIMQEQVPLKIVILNNGHLGMVRQWQELFFDERYSFVAIESPDFVALAGAYGIAGERVHERSELTAALSRCVKSTGAFLLEVVVKKDEKIFPLVPSGASLDAIRLS